MKKRISSIAIALSLFACATMTSCNYDMVDTNYTWDKAIITMNGKTIIVDIEQWKDYEGEQIQLITKDGSIILTSSYNCMLVRNGEDIVNEFTED